LEKYGVPSHPTELSQHSCLHYGQIVTGNQWQLNHDDREYQVTVKGVLCSNNGEVLKEAAVEGLGIALLPTFIIEPELKLKTLAIVLPEYQPPAIALCLIYPLNRHLNRKIQLFVEFFRKNFGENSI
jgi:DNA-binding transcriptional LysR family regulator